MPRSRGPRVARGAAAASVATFVALMSHVAGGGAPPGWLGIVVPWVFAVMICTLLAGRALSVARLSLAVALSQLLFHALFVLGAPSAGALVIAHHHAAPTLSTGGADIAVAAVAADAVMWIWHGVAAIATIAVIHRGERSVRALGDLARDVVATLRRLASAVTVPPTVHGPRDLARPLVVERILAPLGHHVRTVSRRGPPSLSVI